MPSPVLRLAVPALLAAFAPAALASDWFVDQNYANCSTGTGSPLQPFCTIGRAIQVALGGDVIHVAPGTYFEKLGITNSITIEGTQGAATTIVSGGHGQRVADIAAGTTVALKGLSFVDGMDWMCGGIVVDVGASVTLSDCVFSNDNGGNASYSEGGALRVQQATLVAERCTFAANYSSHDGGAIGVVKGALTLLDCDLHDNRATSNILGTEAGGALAITPGSTVDLERTSFTNNAALPGVLGSTAATGGAIEGSGFTAVDCTFTGNVAAYSLGGAIHGSSFSLLRCAFDSNSAAFGGAIHGDRFTATGCRFTSNKATGFQSGGSGGAVLTGSGSSLQDCVFEKNVAADGGAFGGSGSGGALDLAGTAAAPSSLVRCRLFRNSSRGATGGVPYGGGARIGDWVSIVDSEIVSNYAYGAGTGGAAGAGGGLVSLATNSFSLSGCTIGGNLCTGNGTLTSGGDGGGIEVLGTVCDLDHCVIAGNVTAIPSLAQDVGGAVNSLGWNDFGSTAGATISGPGTNDLLDVDPLYLDPVHGDFHLTAASPCVDSGDPTRAPSGRDVANVPRFLDGNLDRVQVLDRGAHEFDHVALSVTGSLTPGGTVTLAADGTAGLPVLLFVGVATAELDVKPFGALYVDLSQPFILSGFGTLPKSQTFVLSAGFPVPTDLTLQAAAFSGTAGNLSNVVEAAIR